tara:strand:- start:1140 stop:1289 length:150 start_codon:yes stop_codon:yes gene_type:complete
MSESPVSSDPEKAVYSDNKTAYDNATPVYVDGALEEDRVEGFEETRELK